MACKKQLQPMAELKL